MSRTSFNSSQLVRLLSDLQVAEVAESTQTLAERLSQWVGWTDSIALADALSGTYPALPRRARAASGAAAAGEAARLRADLARDIEADPLFAGGVEADAATCRACYLAHQQSMQARITPLRDKLRIALSTRSAALGKLAALDAAFERALGVRERQLLTGIPALLEKRWSRMGSADSSGAAGQPADGAEDIRANGPTMQQLLLAELEIRMSPIDGMIAALAEDASSPS